MRFRFIRVLAVLALLGGVYAGLARALDFDDEDPEPFRAEVGQVVEFEIGSHAGCLPHRYEVQSGQLPPGLKLGQQDDHTALVDGIPAEAGSWGVWLAVRDCADKSAEQLFTFEISRRTYGIKTASLPPAAVGASYSAKLEAGDRPARSVKWEVSGGSLPAGLALAADGTISGTPTSSGKSAFTVTVRADGDDGKLRTDSRQLTLEVSGSISVSASRRAAEVGIAFRSSLTASGGQAPYRWSATGAPPGLSVGADGVISGVPTRAGSYTLTAHLVDANGATKDATVALVVYPRLAIATARLPAALSGRPYSAKIAIRGGAPGFRWRIVHGRLPRGLALAASTGTVAGTPAAKGAARITVRVRDSLGAVVQKALVLSVR
jgi:hypothetical protein